MERTAVFDFVGMYGGLRAASWGNLQNPAAGVVSSLALGFLKWFGRCQRSGSSLRTVVVKGFADGRA